jgi:hypothetical protein
MSSTFAIHALQKNLDTTSVDLLDGGTAWIPQGTGTEGSSLHGQSPFAGLPSSDGEAFLLDFLLD